MATDGKPPPIPLPPHPPRGQCAKRSSILDAAATVFCRDGYSGASIDLIAAEAGVSRQTVYNHHGGKENLFAAVVKDINDRSTAGWAATLASFPDHPRDLEAELTGFAVRLTRNCMCDRDAKALRRLVQAEGERYPELFRAWRDFGPGRAWSALAARFAKLAHAGHLDIDDPDLAARQFLALVNADIQARTAVGDMPSDAEIETAAQNAVRTFLRAFARRAGERDPRPDSPAATLPIKAEAVS
jgi:AcrR family transcriptional regulator